MDTVCSKLGQGLASEKTETFPISMVLIILCAFFLPWGAGMQKVATIYISKVFVAFSLGQGYPDRQKKRLRAT